MSTALLERAKTKLIENKLLTDNPHSPYHDDYLFCDKPGAPQHKLDPHDPSEFRGHPTKGRKLPRLSEHIIPFHGDRSVTFVGPCAEKAKATLDSWLAKNTPKQPAGWAKLNGSQVKLCSEIPMLKLETVEGVPSLTLHKSEWNDFLLALYQEGVGLTGLPLDAA